MPSHADSQPPVRFLHTADLHLDSPLCSLALRDVALPERLRLASRTLLQSLVDAAIEHQVDAVLIAGDLFDSNQRDFRTVRFLRQCFAELERSNIPVFLIRGNHDAEVGSKQLVDFPDNVHEFDGRGGQQTFADGRAVVHGVSYGKRIASESLLPKFKPAIEGKFNIGLLHTSLAGHGDHETYAPCTLDELLAFNYDYWALGHIHKRAVHHSDPAIVMPGNPLGRHIREAGERSVTLVELKQGSAPALKTLDLAPIRFEQLPLAIDGIESWAELIDRMETCLAQLEVHAPQELKILRLVLTGQSPLAPALGRDRDLLLEAARELVEGRNELAIDSIDLRQLNPVKATQQDSSASPLDMSTLLEASAQAARGKDIHLNRHIREELEKLNLKLPPSLRTSTGDAQLWVLDKDLDAWIDSGLEWAQQLLADTD